MQKRDSRKIILQKLGGHPDDRPVYRQIGRVHVLSKKDDEIKRQEKIIDIFEDDIKKISERKDVILKKLEEAQTNLREMLAQRKQ